MVIFAPSGLLRNRVHSRSAATIRSKSKQSLQSTLDEIEDDYQQRLLDVRLSGYRFLKPPGVSKTLKALQEEQDYDHDSGSLYSQSFDDSPNQTEDITPPAGFEPPPTPDLRFDDSGRISYEGIPAPGSLATSPTPDNTAETYSHQSQDSRAWEDVHMDDQDSDGDGDRTAYSLPAGNEESENYDYTSNLTLPTMNASLPSVYLPPPDS